MRFVKLKDFYVISETGIIKSLSRIDQMKNGISRIKKEKTMIPRFDKDGYKLISLYDNGLQKNFRVHRLVAETFIPNPENKSHVNHKNGIKSDC